MADVISRGRNYKASDDGARKTSARRAAVRSEGAAAESAALAAARADAEVAFRQTLDAVDERMSTQRKLEVHAAMSLRLLTRLAEIRAVVEADPELKRKLGRFFSDI